MSWNVRERKIRKAPHLYERTGCAISSPPTTFRLPTLLPSLRWEIPDRPRSSRRQRATIRPLLPELHLLVPTPFFWISRTYNSHKESHMSENAIRGSIMNLPDELLRMIFVEYNCLDYPIHPILSVCRRWRAIASDTPQLWRRLLLSVDAVPKLTRTESTIVCTSCETSKAVLANSGTKLSLEVTLSLGPSEPDRPRDKFPNTRRRSPRLINGKKPIGEPLKTAEPQERVTLFRSLRDNNQMDRISSLNLVINQSMLPNLLWDSLHGVFGDGSTLTPLPALECLMITVPGDDEMQGIHPSLMPLFHAINETSFNIREIYLKNVGEDLIQNIAYLTPPISQPGSRIPNLWKRLKCIRIDCGYHMDIALFSGCDKLENLSILGGFTYHPDSDTSTTIPPTSRTKTKEKKRGCHSRQSSTSSSGSSSSEDSSIPWIQRVDLPELQSLHAGVFNLSTLRRLHLPKIHTLIIKNLEEEMDEGGVNIYRRIELKSLRVLKVATTSIGIKAISAPHLEYLRLEYPSSGYRDEFNEWCTENCKTDDDGYFNCGQGCPHRNVASPLQATHDGQTKVPLLNRLFDGDKHMLHPLHLSLAVPLHAPHLLSALQALHKLKSLEVDSRTQLDAKFLNKLCPTGNPQSPSSADSQDGAHFKHKDLVPELQSLSVDLHRHPSKSQELCGGHLALE
ncbi:hypothetical protein CPB86DRAFT_793161 [Serendipita vermifera]|nr:hypothetical protein CPB86DRAFT_793161 [Serendipita vermifera]